MYGLAGERGAHSHGCLLVVKFCLRGPLQIKMLGCVPTCGTGIFFSHDEALNWMNLDEFCAFSRRDDHYMVLRAVESMSFYRNAL